MAFVLPAHTLSSRTFADVGANAVKPVVNLLRARPILAVFELTLQCNSACRYCDLPLNLGRPELNRRQIKTMFQRLYAEGIRLVFLQGGEPTLDDDIPF